MKMLSKIAVAVVSLGLVSVASAENVNNYQRVVYLDGVAGSHVISVSSPVGSLNSVLTGSNGQATFTVTGYETDPSKIIDVIPEGGTDSTLLDGSVVVRVGTDNTHYQDVTIHTMKPGAGYSPLTSIVTSGNVGGYQLSAVNMQPGDMKGDIHLTFKQA